LSAKRLRAHVNGPPQLTLNEKFMVWLGERGYSRLRRHVVREGSKRPMAPPGSVGLPSKTPTEGTYTVHPEFCCRQKAHRQKWGEGMKYTKGATGGASQQTRLRIASARYAASLVLWDDLGNAFNKSWSTEEL
jgi:hypothetical protein